MPSSKPSSKISPPWLTAEAKELIRLKNAAWKRYKKCRSLENAIRYRKANALMRRKIKTDKKEAWISFINNIHPSNSIEDNWQRVRKAIGIGLRSNVFALQSGSDTITDPEQIAEDMATYLSTDLATAIHADCRAKMTKFEQDKPNLFRPTRNSSLTAPITLTELEKALQYCGSNAPGLDNITFGMLKKTTFSFRIRLLELYRSVMASGCFPQEWKLAEVVLIPKVTTTIISPTETRPISLLRSSSKLLEKILSNRLSWLLEQKLSPIVVGFRPARGCLSLLQEVQHNLACALSRRQHSVLVSIDLHEAFDRVQSHVIVMQLVEWNVDRDLIRIIHSFLNGRRFLVGAQGHRSTIKHSPQGLPQGSPLSVTLFNVYIHSLSKILEGIPNLFAYIYADNIILHSSGKPDTVQNTLRTAYSAIDGWCELNGACISSDKTEALHVCRKRNCSSSGINFGALLTPFSESTKILGMHFTPKLKWEKQINSVIHSTKRMNNLLKILCTRKNGPPVPFANHIVKTLIIGRIDYGLTLYGYGSKMHLSKLQAVINEAARIASGALRTTPIECLLAETGFPTVQDRLKKLAANTVLKNIHNPSYPLHEVIHDLIRLPDQRLMKNSNIFLSIQKVPANLRDIPSLPLQPFKSPPPWTIFPSQIHTNHNTNPSLPKEVKASTFRASIETQNFESYLYTDASKSASGTAYAVVDHVRTTLATGKIPTWCSVFTAELVAILEAIRMVADSKVKTAIVSDSLSAIEAVRNVQNNNPAATYIRCKLVDNHNLHIVWCPAHVGVSGNEAADKAAKHAAANANNLIVPFDFTSAKKAFVDQMKESAVSFANQSSKFLFQHSNPFEKPFSLNLPRRLGIDVTRVRLGHFLAVKRHLFEKEQPPRCTHCPDSVLDACHVFLTCPVSKAAFIRHKLVSQNGTVNLHPAEENVPLLLRTIRDILPNSNSPPF